jgi:hypothetical protein
MSLRLHVASFQAIRDNRRKAATREGDLLTSKEAFPVNSQRKCRTLCRISALLLVVVLTAATLLFAKSDPGIAPPDSNPLGKSYAEWGAAWWQWAFSLPANVPLHPLLATGNVDCSYGQQGQVWFLAGTFMPGSITRTCTVPTGTRLFFPMFNGWADNVAVPDPFTVAELKALAASFADAGSLHASIDGADVQDPFRYRAAYAPFGYTVPFDDNLLRWFRADAPGTDWPSTFVFPAASDGYWLMLEPLPPGTHTVNFGGSSKDGSFTLDITYVITVVPKGRF